MQSKSVWSSVFFGLLGTGSILALWLLASQFVSASRLPSPFQVGSAILHGWNQVPAVAFFTFKPMGFAEALLYTALNVSAGVAVGSVIGFLFGILLAKSARFRFFASPIVDTLGVIPLVVLLPFLLLWFGTSPIAQSGLVVVYAFLTVSFAAFSATETVGNHYTNYAACLGARPSQIFWRVTIPAIMPECIGAVRLAMAAGWGWQAVAELLGGKLGIGRIIRATANLGAVADLLAAVVCITVTALIIDAIIVFCGAYIVRWQEASV